MSIATQLRNPNPACPHCHCRNTVRKGKRRNRLRTLQMYRCTECFYRFTGEAGKNRTYPLRVILEAISTFNLGYSLTETQRRIRERAHIPILGPRSAFKLDQPDPTCKDRFTIAARRGNFGKCHTAWGCGHEQEDLYQVLRCDNCNSCRLAPVCLGVK